MRTRTLATLACLARLPLFAALALAPAAARAQAPQVTHACDAVHPLPRPCDGAATASAWSSIYFEVTVPQALGGAAKIDPDTVELILSWPGQPSLPVLAPGRQWASGFTGEANGEWTADGRMGWGFLSRPSPALAAPPLPAATPITARVRARTFGGTPIDASTATWTFTTRRDLAGSTWTVPLDLAGPTVHWEGRWFAGEVKVNFDSSRLFDQGPVYDLMAASRVEAPEFLLQQRDYPLFGDYWQARIFDGNPNLMRERETRRIVAMVHNTPTNTTVLTLTDTIEHALYGVPDDRPLADDYHVGDRVLVCDATQCEQRTVRSVSDADRKIHVDRLQTPLYKWNLKADHVPPADDPRTPDNFPHPVGTLRKFEPVGTPVYYWTRLDDELDQHVAGARRPVMVLHGTPVDACRLGRPENELGGECTDRPKSYVQWDNIVRALVTHLVDRYGEQTLDWYWSIGNEPELFWTGTDDEFLAYYDYTANAILRGFEERGLPTATIRIGGGEATGIFPGYEDQLLYHASPTATFPGGQFEERNHACIDPNFTGQLAARVAAPCAANANKGTPLDFISVHTYDHADAAAADLQRTHGQARAMDPTTFDRLAVNSHETTPDWIPRRDPDSRDGYRWGGFVSSWGADYFRRMLEPAMTDPRRARGEALMTVWPFNYNVEGVASIAGQLRIDVDGDGTQDRVDAVKSPFWLFAEAAARMSHDVAPIPARVDAGVVLSGWRSTGAVPDRMEDRILLYAHDKFDTGTNERGGWDVQLELSNVRFPLVEVREYRIDRDHPARAALAALPPRTSTGLHRPAEVAAFEAAADLLPHAPPQTYAVAGGRLALSTRLLSQGVVYLDLRRPDPDGDAAFDPDDNCPATANPLQDDADADAHGDACDCAPADPGAFAPPVEVAGLTLTRTGAGATATDGGPGAAATLRWTSAAPGAGAGTVYDVYRELEGFGPPGAAPGAECLATGLAVPEYTEPSAPSPGPTPAPGTAWRYLVRARNACAPGPWSGTSPTLPCGPGL